MLVNIIITPTATSPPYLYKLELNVNINKLSDDCIINGAIPKVILGNIIFLSNFIYFLCNLNVELDPFKNDNTQIHDTACDNTVAIAAPLTPKSNTNINIGSNIIFKPAPNITDNILILVNPCAVINVFNPNVNNTKIIPNTYILK